MADVGIGGRMKDIRGVGRRGKYTHSRHVAHPSINLIIVLKHKHHPKGSKHGKRHLEFYTTQKHHHGTHTSFKCNLIKLIYDMTFITNVSIVMALFCTSM